MTFYQELQLSSIWVEAADQKHHRSKKKNEDTF